MFNQTAVWRSASAHTERRQTQPDLATVGLPAAAESSNIILTEHWSVMCNGDEGEEKTSAQHLKSSSAAPLPASPPGLLSNHANLLTVTANMLTPLLRVLHQMCVTWHPPHTAAGDIMATAENFEPDCLKPEARIASASCLSKEFRMNVN